MLSTQMPCHDADSARYNWESSAYEWRFTLCWSLVSRFFKIHRVGLRTNNRGPRTDHVELSTYHGRQITIVRDTKWSVDENHARVTPRRPTVVRSDARVAGGLRCRTTALWLWSNAAVRPSRHTVASICGEDWGPKLLFRPSFSPSFPSSSTAP